MLARIHLHRMEGFGDPTQPDKLSIDPRVHFSLKFEENFDECKDHLPKVLLAKCRAYVNDRLDALILTDGPCIVHRDFRPGNIIIMNGKLQAIIDWASAGSSFAEEDFCSIEHENWLNGFKKFFLSGYAHIRPIPNYHYVMPMLRLNKALATIGFVVKQKLWKKTHLQLYKYNRDFLDTFFSNPVGSTYPRV